MAHDEQIETPQVEVVSQRTSGLAVASLALACAGMVMILCCSYVTLGTAIAAVICGHLARAECRRDPSVWGDGLALAGLIVGYASGVMVILWNLAVLAVVFLVPLLSGATAGGG